MKLSARWVFVSLHFPTKKNETEGLRSLRKESQSSDSKFQSFPYTQSFALDFCCLYWRQDWGKFGERNSAAPEECIYFFFYEKAGLSILLGTRALWNSTGKESHSSALWHIIFLLCPATMVRAVTSLIEGTQALRCSEVHPLVSFSTSTYDKCRSSLIRNGLSSLEQKGPLFYCLRFEVKIQWR